MAMNIACAPSALMALDKLLVLAKAFVEPLAHTRFMSAEEASANSVAPAQTSPPSGGLQNQHTVRG